GNGGHRQGTPKVTCVVLSYSAESARAHHPATAARPRRRGDRMSGNLIGSQLPTESWASWVLRGRAKLLNASAAFGLALCSASAPAEEKGAQAVLKLITPTTAVRLFGADCGSRCSCWLSGLFAPVVVRENVNAVPVINTSKKTVTVTV